MTTLAHSSSSQPSWAERNSKNTKSLALWTFGWLITLAVATFGPEFIWDNAAIPTIAIVLLNLAVGIGMVISNKNYVVGLDELNRKIFLDASAITLGVSLVVGISYEKIQNLGLIAFEARISHLVVVMALTFLACTVIGHRHYR